MWPSCAACSSTLAARGESPINGGLSRVGCLFLTANPSAATKCCHLNGASGSEPWAASSTFEGLNGLHWFRNECSSSCLLNFRSWRLGGGWQASGGRVRAVRFTSGLPSSGTWSMGLVLPPFGLPVAGVQPGEATVVVAWVEEGVEGAASDNELNMSRMRKGIGVGNLLSRRAIPTHVELII